MEHNKPHAGDNSLMYFFNELVGNLVVSRVTPPDKHVGVVEHLVGQAAMAL